MVRLATKEDENNFLELFSMLHSEVGGEPLNSDKIKELFQAHINEQGAIIGVIGDLGKPLKAFVALTINQPFYSSKFVLYEYGTFVHPDHRSGGCFKELVDFSKGVSDKLKLELYVGVRHSGRVKLKLKLYRKFFEEFATQFKYQPKV